MHLDAWLEREGHGASARLRSAAGVSHPTIIRARQGRATLSSALKISAATEYVVDVASMTAEAIPDMPPKKRVRGRT